MQNNFIPLMVPDLRDSDLLEVRRVLESGMLVQGREVALFEESIANYLGLSHAIAVSNGTAALHLSLLALEIGKGDEVIVPAFSYIATANVVELVGAKPIFVDIDNKTFNIDVSQIEKAITHKTKAIIPVHEFGLSADIKKIVEIAKKHNLFVIEDAACALGAAENSKLVGTFGDLGSFSFHPRKAITSGEGGLIVTNNDFLAKKLRALRNHGIEMIDNKMEFICAGFNYRMTDFQAALLNSQFKRFDWILERKREIANQYQKNINNSKIHNPFIPEKKEHAWQTYHVLWNDEENRDEIIITLKNKGIGTNYGAQCIPAQKYFQNKYKLNCKKLFPNALKAYNQGLAIPIYEKLTSKQINYIIETLNNF
jgi:dTDP-4-amino-4,6-dideoxygalactose transaminase